MRAAPVVLLTQRVVAYPHREERGDYLDQRWSPLVRDLGGHAYLVPNHKPTAIDMYARLAPDLLVLTGGNNLSPTIRGAAFDDAAELPDDLAEERDATENALVDLAERDGVLMLGVCRGAQLLAVRRGATLRQYPGHAGTEHAVRRLPWPSVQGGHPPWASWPERFTVASHHRWVLPGVDDFPPDLRPLLVAHDQTVEAFTDPLGRALALMWHPERETCPSGPGRTALSGILRHARGDM